MSGILPLTRQLGDYFEREPVPELLTIQGPQRPTQGRWPADVWAEMESIYATPDPLARQLNHDSARDRKDEGR